MFIPKKICMYMKLLTQTIDDPMKPSARKDFVKPFLSFKTSDGNFLSVIA